MKEKIQEILTTKDNIKDIIVINWKIIIYYILTKKSL